MLFEEARPTFEAALPFAFVECVSGIGWSGAECEPEDEELSRLQAEVRLTPPMRQYRRSGAPDGLRNWDWQARVQRTRLQSLERQFGGKR